jgi:ABC-type dipeptide/oligopeptide/nickel transport system ATPase component
MHRGRVLETGTVRQILKDPLHPYTKGLLAAMPAERARGRLDTVIDLVTEEDMLPHPLIEIRDERKLALPLDRIPQAMRL